MRVVRVAVPVPQLGALTYAVPDSRPVPRPGVRVLVPLGARTVTGVVVDSADETGGGDPGELKPLLDVVDEEPLVPADVLSLVTWVAEYYACGIGDAVAAA